MNKQTVEIKKRFRFIIRVRFEIFYALQVLTDKNSRVHRRWREQANANMHKEFERNFRLLGNSSVIWPVIADTLRTKSVHIDFPDIIKEISNQKINEFQREILCSAFHYEELVDKLLKNKISFPHALGKIPKVKQEWLAFIGLHPYLPDEPMALAMERLITDPERFRRGVIMTLELFWESSFCKIWQKLQPQFERSLEEKERLFESCSFDEFSKLALLRIEVDERTEHIKAARGGYKLTFKNLKEGYFLPSAFNDKRYWSAFKDGEETIVFFPYFDPSITVDMHIEGGSQNTYEPELDPAFIFKALGDSTRFAIVRILAKNPKNSVDVAKILSVSKPTISHHVHILRDAGLINETYLNGSVLLSLRREVFENISQLTVTTLFGRDYGHEQKIKRS